MKQKDILFFVIGFFFLAVAWGMFTVLHSAVSSTISESVSMQIAPIASSFNTNVITLLKKREKIIPLSVSLQPTPASGSGGQGGKTP